MGEEKFAQEIVGFATKYSQGVFLKGELLKKIEPFDSHDSEYHIKLLVSYLVVSIRIQEEKVFSMDSLNEFYKVINFFRDFNPHLPDYRGPVVLFFTNLSKLFEIDKIYTDDLDNELKNIEFHNIMDQTNKDSQVPVLTIEGLRRIILGQLSVISVQPVALSLQPTTPDNLKPPT